jgi:hypothetical protein
MIREPFSIEEMKILLKKYKKSEIEVSQHYLNYLAEGKRDIGEEEIKNFLLSHDFYFVEKQINSWTRYKIIYKLSVRYDLVVVVKEEQKVLKVASAYKTNKKLKEQWKKTLKFRTIR